MDRAKAFLHHELANGPVDHSVLMQRAEPHALTLKTLQRAASDMGIIKSKKGFDGGWEWGFPVSRQQINELFAPFGLPPMEH